MLIPLSADGAGLGRLTVLSAFGQQFHAEIDLISDGQLDLSALTARIASPETYHQLNVPYGAVEAGLRVSVDRRPAGQPYIKITSVRYINETFVSLVIELAGPFGRLVRHYTALLDPPLLDAPAPAPQPSAAYVPSPGARPAPTMPAPAVSPSGAARSYGPIRRGQTLGQIARELLAEGVSLVQMIIGLFQGNPEAFLRNNLNLVKEGQTLRVPPNEELAAIPQDEAVRQYREQVAAWTAYRERAAEAAGTRAVGDAAKDVTRISRGAPPGAPAPRNLEERARILEEEAVAGDKALAEATDRIAQLEKSIKSMQALAERTREATVATGDQAGAKPEPTPGAAPAAAIADKTKAATPADQAATVPAAPEGQVQDAAKRAQQEETKRVDQLAAGPAATVRPAERAGEVIEPAPAPQPEPGLIDAVTENLPLVGGGAAALLLAAGLWFARRRRLETAVAAEAAEEMGEAEAGEIDDGAPQAAKPDATDSLDVLEEARVFIAHGREAQAAKLLEEALANNPLDENVRLKLLEIHAARKDKAAFGKCAQVLHDVTGGQGGNWLKAAAMGFAIDPDNALYEAGRSAEVSAPSSEEAMDFDFQGEMPEPAEGESPAGPEAASEPGVDVEIAVPAGESTTDISFDERDSATPSTDLPLDADEAATERSADFPIIDFNLEVPKDEETPDAGTGAAPTKGDAADSSPPPDLKLDLSGINLDLDEDRKPDTQAEPEPGAEEKDPHWHDVQEKFELVKAYKLLGAETDSIVEILQDILKEGDAGQRAEARKLLDELSGDSKK